MTDRELLELAAKAAGYEVEADHRGDLGFCREEDVTWDYWDPLKDDGDAFRLAVKLKLPIEFPTDSPYGPDRVAVNIGLGIVESMTPGPCSATRRAIVRAAAEVGKGMV